MIPSSIRVALSIVVATLVASCAVPELDRSGAIACGEGNEAGACPASFVCRFGRCCPESSNADSCPASTFVTPSQDGSAYACATDGSCPAPAANVCRFGRCCPRTGGTGVCDVRGIGNACGSASDCAAPTGLTATCATTLGDPVNLPHGYCTAFQCDLKRPNESCGANGVCTGFLVTGCVARCDLTPGSPYTPCRGEDPYSCFPSEPEVAGSTRGYCAPDCARDPTICRSGYRCNVPAHACEKLCRTTSECPGAQFACIGGSCTDHYRTCFLAANCPREPGVECRNYRCVDGVARCNAVVPCVSSPASPRECLDGVCVYVKP